MAQTQLSPAALEALLESSNQARRGEFVSAASAFVEKDVIGHSPNDRTGRFDALELDTDEWEVTPFAVTEISSSYFERLPDDAPPSITRCL